MQRSWRSDADKLTFIACAAPPPPSADTSGGETPPAKSPPPLRSEDDADDRMLGDVNLFFSTEDAEPEPDDGAEGAVQTPQRRVGEVEIMIARREAQGRGYGPAVLRAFLWYIGAVCLQDGHFAVDALRVRIGAENVRSLRLFEREGFARVGDGRPNFFGEVELRMELDAGRRGDDVVQGLRRRTEGAWVEPVLLEYRAEREEDREEGFPNV